MKEWPEFNEHGDLPVGIYRTTLAQVVEQFGSSTWQRRLIAQRLSKIYNLVVSSNYMARFVIYGSFVTSKPDPNDIDIFLLMEDGFNPAEMKGTAAFIFDHMAAHNYEGASIFWTIRAGALGGEQMAIEDWQYKRDNTRRGIVEVISRD